MERRGEFAVRGGILDVFPPTEDHPVRVEFWGDTVEEIRWFKVADQRSLEVAEHGLWAPPCRELLLTDVVRERAAPWSTSLGRPGPARQAGRGHRGRGHGVARPRPRRRHGERARHPPRGHDRGRVRPERVRTRAHDLVATSQEFLGRRAANAAAGNAVPIDLQGVLGTASFWGLADLRAHAREAGLPWWDLNPFTADAELADDATAVLDTGLTEAPRYRGSTPEASRTCAVGPRAGGSWS